jgi:hypothetical protein
MIMPLLFGAFANFLLPTQLGVHDVAFPRLNSAAFWFLPAGFLMLAQMICIDRRYQRMNCFNIREIQTLLRSRYHPDRWDVNEHHTFLHETALGLRLKLLNLSSVSPNMLLSNEYGLTTTAINRAQMYYYRVAESTDSYMVYLVYTYTYALKDWLINFLYPFNYNYIYSLSYEYLTSFSSSLGISPSLTWAGLTNWNLFEYGRVLSSQISLSVVTSQVILSYFSEAKSFISSFSNYSIVAYLLSIYSGWFGNVNFASGFGVYYDYPSKSAPASLNYTFNFLISEASLSYLLSSYSQPLNILGGFLLKFNLFSQLVFYQFSNLLGRLTTLTYQVTALKSDVIRSDSNLWSTVSQSDRALRSAEEHSDNSRRQRSSTPVVGYNFKVGDFYPSTTLKFYPTLFRSLSDVTRGVRRSPW